MFDPIARCLMAKHYLAVMVSTVPAVWQSVIQKGPFAVVIDATSPTLPWRPWELCRDLSEGQSALIVLLLADDADCCAERAKAYEQGADHCVPAGPGSADELIAYLAAQWARRRAQVNHDGPSSSEPSLQINWETHQVVRAGAVIPLSPKECALLHMLKEYEGRVVPSNKIVRTLWRSRSQAAATGNLKQVVRNLRVKIEGDPSSPVYLVNVRGRGYLLKAGSTANTSDAKRFAKRVTRSLTRN